MTLIKIPKEVRELLAAIPRFLLLLGRLLGDGRVSLADKAMLAAAIVYAISPLDLMPDFLPFIGQLDDLYLVALAIDRLLIKAGPEVLMDHWSGPDHVLEALCGGIDTLARYLPASVERSLTARVQDG